MKFNKNHLSSLALATFLTGISSQAFAWGCVALSVDKETDQTTWSEIVYGYSFNFYDQIPAQEKALYECSIRIKEDRICKLLMCESGF